MQWWIGESGTTIFILLDTISTFLETYRYQSTIYQDLAERLEKVCYKCRDLILMSGDRYFRSKVELLRRSYMVVNFIKSGYCGLLTSHAASVDITTVFLGAPIWHWVLKTASQKKEERKKPKKRRKRSFWKPTTTKSENDLSDEVVIENWVMVSLFLQNNYIMGYINLWFFI